VVLSAEIAQSADEAAPSEAVIIAAVQRAALAKYSRTRSSAYTACPVSASGIGRS